MYSKKYAQFSIMSIFGVLITLIVFGALYPTIADILSSIEGLDSGTQAVLNLVPFFMVLAIIIGIIYHAIPIREVWGGQ